MTVHKWYALGASLLSVFLLSGTNSALAQNVGVRVGGTQLGVSLGLPLINQTKVDVVVPPTADVGKLGVGVSLGSGTLFGTVPVPNTTAPDLAVAGNTGSLGPRLDLLPTCR